MTSRLSVWICEVQDEDGYPDSDRENFTFGQPLKGLVARKWFDHDGSLGGDLEYVRADELLELAERAATFPAAPELRRLIHTLQLMKPDSRFKITITA